MTKTIGAAKSVDAWRARACERSLVFALLILVSGCASMTTSQPREALSDGYLVRGGHPIEEQAEVVYQSRFTGKLFLVLLDDKTHGSQRDGRSLWGLSEDLRYAPSDGSGVITVPKGFVTDLASIPRPFWTLLPADGPWTKAAVVHDYLYYTHGSGVWKGHPKTITHTPDYTRAEADWILRDAMEDRGVDVVRRNIIYEAVRFGGAGGWRH